MGEKKEKGTEHKRSETAMSCSVSVLSFSITEQRAVWLAFSFFIFLFIFFFS